MQGRTKTKNVQRSGAVNPVQYASGAPVANYRGMTIVRSNLDGSYYFHEKGQIVLKHLSSVAEAKKLIDELHRDVYGNSAFHLVEGNNDWGTWQARDLKEAIQLLMDDVKKRPEAYMGTPDVTKIKVRNAKVLKFEVTLNRMSKSDSSKIADTVIKTVEASDEMEARRKASMGLFEKGYKIAKVQKIRNSAYQNGVDKANAYINSRMQNADSWRLVFTPKVIAYKGYTIRQPKDNKGVYRIVGSG